MIVYVVVVVEFLQNFNDVLKKPFVVVGLSSGRGIVIVTSRRFGFFGLCDKKESEIQIDADALWLERVLVVVVVWRVGNSCGES